MVAPTKQDDDDLPAGLRSATQVTYGKQPEPKKKDQHDVVHAPPKQITSPTGAAVLDNFIKELEDAKSRGQRPLLHPELTPDTDTKLTSNIQPVAEEVVDPDAPEGLKTSTKVDYNVTKAPEPEPFFTPAKQAEMGVGAIAGAVVSRKQQKARALNAEIEAQKVAHLPPEMRPVSPASLQRYINSQFSVQIPLEKLNQITGMDIRTMKEVQEARRMIEGTEAQREPVVKDVGGRRKTVAYRNTPAQSPIDISQFVNEPPSIAHRISNAISEGTKSAATGAYNRMRPIFGGMVAAPQLLEAGTDYLHNKPVDLTQVASGFGGIGMMTQNKTLGALGAAAQLPYAIKHREELLNNMTMNDINPLAFPAGTAESMSSPMEAPTSFGTISGVLQRANEQQRKKLGYDQQQPQAPQMSYGEKMREENRRVFPKKEGTLLDYLSFPAYMGAVAGRRD